MKELKDMVGLTPRKPRPLAILDLVFSNSDHDDDVSDAGVMEWLTSFGSTSRPVAWKV